MLSMFRGLARFGIDFCVVAYAVGRYALFGKSPLSSHRLALMRMHCYSNARFSDFLAKLFAPFYGQRRSGKVDGLLGNLSIEGQGAIVAKLNEDGFYIFEEKLPPELCDAIEKFARETPAVLEGRGSAPAALEVFDPAHPKSKTYRLREDVIAQHPGMQKLMADPSILAIAERYIGATPNLSMLNLWWSANYGSEPGADAAQMFHFDFDPPPKWLLFFVYLTDVGANNGPHVYVKGSHKAGHPAASELLKRGYVRISDEEMARAFGPENVIEIHGGRGTVLAVDTRGFHKGKVLSEGCRLMAQLTYSFPVFAGAHGGVEPLKNVSSPDLLNAAHAAPKVFSRYFPAK